MTNIRETYRQAARHAWATCPNGADAHVYVADAVAVAVGQEFRRYRPQHDENCSINVCVTCREHEPVKAHGRNIISPNHEFVSTGVCSCGLDTLLAECAAPKGPEPENK